MSYNIYDKLNLYTNQLSQHKESIYNIVCQLIDDLYDYKQSIFITGVGKSGHIARKCVATWQSLGIRSHFLHPQDCFHGDMGVIRPGDMILYISNSGKTEELVHLASYLGKRGLLQIGIINAINSPLEQVVTKSCIISPNDKILEADAYSIVPSISSTIFMIILDLVGIGVIEKLGFTEDAFRRNHPSGALGKKD